MAVDRRSRALIAAALLAIALSISFGGLSSGYGKDGWGLLLRVGVAYLALGVATDIRAPTDSPKAALSGVVALTVVFVAGSLLMYVDFALLRANAHRPPTALDIASHQLDFVFVTLPVVVGYVSGALIRSGRSYVASVLFLSGGLVGFVGGYAFAVLQWNVAPLAQLYYILAVTSTSILGLVPLGVIGWMKPSTER